METSSTETDPERKVWEIGGHCKEWDSYIFPGDSDEEYETACVFAAEWLDDMMNTMESGEEEMSLTFRLRPRTKADDEVLDGPFEESH